MDTDFSTCFGSNDIEFIWLTLKNTIHNAIQLFIPKIKLKSHQHPKWFNAKITHQLKCLHTLRKKLKLRYSTNIMSKIESYESELLNDMSSAKALFETQMIKSFDRNNASTLYSYINRITGCNSIPTYVWIFNCHI